MAIVDGGYSSGTWGEAGWGCSVYYPLVANAGWGLGAWGSDGWGLGDGGLVTASDQTNVAGTAPVTVFIEESAVASDFVFGQPIKVGAVSETATAADTVFGVFALGTSVAESAAASETVSSLFTINGRITETATAADVVSSLANVNARIAESVVATDAVTPLRTTFGTVSETAAGLDEVLSTPAYRVVVDETALGNAEVTSVFAIPNNIGEGVVAADDTNVFNTMLTSIVEAANVSLTVAAQANFAVHIAETNAATDVDSATGRITVFVSDSATVSDRVSRRLLWEPIDTGVDEDWTLINTNL